MNSPFKIRPNAGHERRRQRGYASMAMVAVVGMITLFGLLVTYRDAMRSHESEKRSQIRLDYTQKEDAFLRALVANVPNRAIDAMRDQSRSRANNLTWQQIFNEAIEMANAEQSISAQMLIDTGLQDAIVANPGDDDIASSGSIVTPVVGSGGYVNPGVTQSSPLLLDSRFSDKLPDPLATNAAVALDDSLHPVITHEKQFSAGWNTEADLSVDQYPLFNRIPYPNIRFGYTTPGNRFVAKRNWWAFSVRFGGQAAGANGDEIAPLLTKHYVLSIYEVPSQLPISAESFMTVGRHADGTLWSNVAVDGDISAGILQTEGGFALPSGKLSGRRGLILGAGTSAGGQALRDDFDDLGVRESIFASEDSDTYGASLSANSGRVAFVPISRGLDFYRLPPINETNTISPTTWDEYSTGAINCRTKVIVTKVEAADDQTPTRLEIRYRAGTVEQVATLERGVNWPYAGESGGDTVPFQTEHTENGRKALVVLPERLPDYLANLGGSTPDVNNSLLLTVDKARDPNILEPVFPSVETETVVVLKESADLTPWAQGGLSIVTNLRLYFADNFNIVSTNPPAGSGVTGEFFPPVSVFAPEKRFGTTLKIRPVDFSGQVGTLSEGDAVPFHPLDMKAGTHETVTGDLINADLKPIVSPAQLPPIYLMNWLVTVEEIH